MTRVPYDLNDVLLLLGQCTVELAYLRARVAELEARLAETSASSNGTEKKRLVRSDAHAR